MPDFRHILSPIPHREGRSPVCGAEDTVYPANYSGFDEAYRAAVEGWASTLTPLCPVCVAIFAIAVKPSAPRAESEE